MTAASNRATSPVEAFTNTDVVPSSSCWFSHTPRSAAARSTATFASTGSARMTAARTTLPNRRDVSDCAIGATAASTNPAAPRFNG